MAFIDLLWLCHGLIIDNINVMHRINNNILLFIMPKALCLALAVSTLAAIWGGQFGFSESTKAASVIVSFGA